MPSISAGCRRPKPVASPSGHRVELTTKPSSSPHIRGTSSASHRRTLPARRNSNTGPDSPFAGFRSFVSTTPHSSRTTGSACPPQPRVQIPRRDDSIARVFPAPLRYDSFHGAPFARIPSGGPAAAADTSPADGRSAGGASAFRAQGRRRRSRHLPDHCQRRRRHHCAPHHQPRHPPAQSLQLPEPPRTRRSPMPLTRHPTNAV
jgi:hypothetical protein